MMGVNLGTDDKARLIVEGTGLLALVGALGEGAWPIRNDQSQPRPGQYCHWPVKVVDELEPQLGLSGGESIWPR